MSETPLVLSVHLNLPDDCTPEEKEEALSQLRQELLETDAQSVENPASGSAPPGAKGLPPGIDALLVTLSHSGAVLGSVLGAITSWTASRSGSVTIKCDGNEFTFAHPTAEEQSQLVKACVAKLAGKKG